MMITHWLSSRTQGLCVADTWDAMLSNRPYRDALSIELAIKGHQRHVGTQFNPGIVDFFVKLSKEEKIEAGPEQAS